jgi:hypothetical protein
MTASARDASLNRVEALLGEALKDLTAMSRKAPGARCSAALAEAAVELQAFVGTHAETGSQSPSLRRQLSGWPTKLRALQGLLASAAEFYGGWCAAAPVAAYPVDCHTEPGPALLAFRG